MKILKTSLIAFTLTALLLSCNTDLIEDKNTEITKLDLDRA